MKQVIILIGLKGSGKTYIGNLIQEKLGIRFFCVEDVWRTLKSEGLSDEYIRNGFSLVEKEIDNLLLGSDRVTIESTGTTEYFNSFLKRLKSKYDLKLIKIETTFNTCLRRVKSRDASIHIPVSDDFIEQINLEASKVDLKFDSVIENEKSTDNEILDKLQKIIS